MARHPTILSSVAPTSTTPAEVTISHIQLRDLIICPRNRGVVNYVQGRFIIEHDVTLQNSAPQTIVDARFLPNSIASLQLDGSDQTLLAAGGQDAELHLSLHSPTSNWQYDDTHDRRHTRMAWRYDTNLRASINNSVLLTSMNLTRSNQSSAEPRVAVSNNDCTVKFYDIPMRGKSGPGGLQPCGILSLDVAVNHSSISPDGRTLLSVGDSPRVHLHQMSGGARVTFSPILTLNLPPHTNLPPTYPGSSMAASFSTAFSANGSKFAVASQEGMVVVWDVRSSKPLKVYETNKSQGSWRVSNSSASGWLVDDPYDLTRVVKAPGWGVRSVKFGPGGTGDNPGGEIMTFTEHTSLFHVIDARTFETEEIVQVPFCDSRPNAPMRPRSSSPRRASNNPVPTRLPSQQQTTPLIVLELENTFRIHPSSGSTTSWNGQRDEDVVVIPRLGDREAEMEVQRLLGQHGIRSRHTEGRDGSQEVYGYATNGRAEEGAQQVEMVDELESDCVSSHTPSRSSSPSPSARLPAQPSSASARLSLEPPMPRVRNRRRTLLADHCRSRDELDLAGVCFDPSGGFIYVASVGSISEWHLRDADKKWWSDSAWC